MSTVSLNSLIDQSVDKVPLFRRMVFKTLLRNEKTRNAFAAVLLEKMQDEPCCSAIVSMAASEDFDGEVMMAIDPENLKAILDFILKILPVILQIFLKV
jgi:hypothetical protein